MQTKTYILLCLLVWQVWDVSAQRSRKLSVKRCPVTTINFENGLINNATTDIITDRSGYTWISTLSGIQKFNGRTLESIQPVVETQPANIKYPVHFFSLQSGLIWISFRGGIIEYEPLRNLFSKRISYLSRANQNFSIIPLLETQEGIWCMHEKLGLVTFDKNGKLIHQYEYFAAVVKQILDNQPASLSNLFTVNNKYIFINNAADKNVLAIDVRSKDFRTLNVEDKNIYSIACNDDKLYLLTNRGMSVININTKQLEKSIDIKSLTNENLLNGSLQCVNNERLIASINNHLYELNPSKLKAVEIVDFKNNAIALAGFILKIYTDSFKRIWLLTNNDVKRITDLEIPFAHFTYANEKNNFVKALYYDERQHILIAGCFNGGLQLYDTSGNALWKKSLITSDVENVVSIEKLESNKYLIITLEKGWFIFDAALKTVKPFVVSKEIEKKLQRTQVNFTNNLQRINDSVILIATSNNAMRCVFKGTQLIAAQPLLANNPDHSISCLHCASDKTVWIGTIKGDVYRIDKSGETKTIAVPERFVVRTIAEDDRHNIWIGTDKGLNIYNASGFLQRRLTMQNGLLNDCIYSILPVTGKAAVFSGTNMGLSYISLEDNDTTIKNFLKEMGLQENEFNTNSAFKSHNGKLYFGGINGITSFYPSALSVIKDAPLLHITSLIVNDSLLDPSAENWKHDTITLSYKQNRLRFSFAALGMLNTNEYVYKYRMLGFENGWQTTSQPAGINYTLQPGNYTLQISYYPILSIGNVFTKDFVIIIHHPWWQTWWFKILAGLIAVAVIALIVHRYNYVKYKAQLRAMQIQHSVQVEKERISRELHDDIGTKVNLLSYNASLLSDAQSTVEMKLIGERIKSSSADMLQSLRETVWTLKQETITIEDVWTRFKNFASKFSSTYSCIEFKIEEEAGESRKVNYNEALSILRILQEAVNNAVKHSNCTVIVCSKVYEDNKVKFTIRDNGQGFDYGLIKQKSEGNGLHNMQQRASDSALKFTLVSNKEHGTCITIKG
jgi:signal transduction histidine kinase/ligand-binding sensor domain-containing protein